MKTIVITDAEGFVIDVCKVEDKEVSMVKAAEDK